MSRTKVLSAFIPNLFPSLNEILRVRSQDRRHGWSGMKKACESAVDKVLNTAKMLPKIPYHVEFRWVEWNARRDPDNIASGGCKPVFDALIKIGIIEDDGWDYFGRIVHEFSIAESKEDIGVEVVFYRDDELIKQRKKELEKNRTSHPPKNKRIVKPKRRGKAKRKRTRNNKMKFKRKKK